MYSIAVIIPTYKRYDDLKVCIQSIIGQSRHPEELIIIPREGAVNIHASLLPKYRGASPIHHAILNGEDETGVTIFRLQKKVDAGDILLQKHFKLNSTITTGEAYYNLANLGAKMIPFAAYLMPVNYKNGIGYEYNAIRNNCCD